MGTYDTRRYPLYVYLLFHVQIYGLQRQKGLGNDAEKRFLSILYRYPDHRDHKIQYAGAASGIDGQGDCGTGDRIVQDKTENGIGQDNPCELHYPHAGDDHYIFRGG